MKSTSQTFATAAAHILTTVLLALVVVVALILVVNAVNAEAETVLFEASAAVDDDELPKGVRAPIFGADAELEIADPTDRERRLAIAIDILPLLLSIAVLWPLNGIARSVRDGDPFGNENVRRLRAIGVVLVAGALAVWYVQGQLQDALAEPYLAPPSDTRYIPGLRPADNDLPDLALLCGLGAFVLAQVFAHGVRLREDVEATI